MQRHYDRYFLKTLRVFDVIVLKNFWVKKLNKSTTRTDFWYVLELDIVDNTHGSQVSPLLTEEHSRVLSDVPLEEVPFDMEEHSSTKEHSQVSSDDPLDIPLQEWAASIVNNSIQTDISPRTGGIAKRINEAEKKKLYLRGQTLNNGELEDMIGRGPLLSP